MSNALRGTNVFEITDFSGGLNEWSNSYNLNKNQLVDLQNVDLRVRGSVMARKGSRFYIDQVYDILLAPMEVLGMYWYRAADGTKQVIAAMNVAIYGDTPETPGQFNHIGGLSSTVGYINFVQYKSTLFLYVGGTLPLTRYNPMHPFGDYDIVTVSSVQLSPVDVAPSDETEIPAQSGNLIKGKFYAYRFTYEKFIGEDALLETNAVRESLTSDPHTLSLVVIGTSLNIRKGTSSFLPLDVARMNIYRTFPSDYGPTTQGLNAAWTDGPLFAFSGGDGPVILDNLEGPWRAAANSFGEFPVTAIDGYTDTQSKPYVWVMSVDAITHFFPAADAWQKLPVGGVNEVKNLPNTDLSATHQNVWVLHPTGITSSGSGLTTSSYGNVIAVPTGNSYLKIHTEGLLDTYVGGFQGAADACAWYDGVWRYFQLPGTTFSDRVVHIGFAAGKCWMLTQQPIAGNSRIFSGLNDGVIGAPAVPWVEETLPALPAGVDLHAVDGPDTDDLVFAVGDDGTILKKTGGSWSFDVSPTNNDLRGLTFKTTEDPINTFRLDGWAVGDAAVTLHYDGFEWKVEIPTFSVTDDTQFYKLDSIEFDDYSAVGVGDVLYTDLGQIDLDQGSVLEDNLLEDIPSAAFASVFKNRMWIGNFADDTGTFPWRVYFSEYDEPGAFRATSFFDVNPDDGEPITRIYNWQNRALIVFKTNSVWAILGADEEAAPGVPLFRVESLDRNIGCIATDSVDIAEGMLIWWSNRGPYFMDGLTPKPFNVELLRKTIGEIPNGRRQNIVGRYWSKEQKFLFGVTSPDAALSLSDTALVWDFYSNSWSKWLIKDKGTSTGISAMLEVKEDSGVSRMLVGFDGIALALQASGNILELGVSEDGDQTGLISLESFDWWMKTGFLDFGKPSLDKQLIAVQITLATPETFTLDVSCDQRLDTLDDASGFTQAPVQVANTLLWEVAAGVNEWAPPSGAGTAWKWADVTAGDVLIWMDSRIWAKRFAFRISGASASFAPSIESIRAFWKPRERIA